MPVKRSLYFGISLMEKYAALIEAVETFAVLATAKKVWGPYKRPDGRLIVVVQDESGKTSTKSYPKHLIETHLGRELLPNETVDHWDTNPLNNSLDNLKVIDRAEHSKQDTRRVKLITLTCDECGKKFQRSPRLMRDKNSKGVRGKFCSKSCAGKYSRKVQLGKADILPVQDHMPSEYYKQKYVDHPKQANDLISYLLLTYATDL